MTVTNPPPQPAATGFQVFSALKGIHPPRDGIRAHVVVGTPGSIVGALDRRKLLLTHCAVFVLDEADAMLEVGACGGVGVGACEAVCVVV